MSSVQATPEQESTHRVHARAPARLIRNLLFTRATFIARVTRNPLTPGLVTWALLMVGYAVAGTAGSSDSTVLLTIGGMFAVLCFFGRYTLVRLPTLPERDGILLVCAGLGAFVLEAAYFGL